MNSRLNRFIGGAVLGAVALLAWSGATLAQSTAASNDRWLHVRVMSTDSKNETVRVNVPLEMAEKILPAINKEQLHSGKIKFNHSEMDGVDIKAILEVVRNSKDGEYVTVQSNENDVRVAKQAGYLFVHVTEKDEHAAKDGKRGEKNRVEVKVPMKVVDALFSAGKDELDVLAALRALSAHGDTELVSVKSDENTVRVWLDSKNVSD